MCFNYSRPKAGVCATAATGPSNQPGALLIARHDLWRQRANHLRVPDLRGARRSTSAAASFKAGHRPEFNTVSQNEMPAACAWLNATNVDANRSAIPPQFPWTGEQSLLCARFANDPGSFLNNQHRR